MTALSRPVYPGSRSHGIAYKPVTVIKTDTSKRVCVVRDNLGKIMEIRCDIMRSKGNLPEPGEIWYVDRQYDIWVFGAILNGSTNGVEVSNVTGLPGQIQQLNDDRTLLKAQTLGQIQAKGDILAATSGSQEVVRQPVGSLNQSLVADPASTTGLTYKDLTGRPAGYSGLLGATSAGRYVGNTAFGAPTAGTFVVGDWVSTNTGYRWVCTAAGTPGTWIERTSALEGRTSTVESRVTTLEAAPSGPRGILARSKITSPSGKTGSQSLSNGTGTLRCYANIVAGRLYRIGSPGLLIQSDLDNARAAVGLRASSDGSNTNVGGVGTLIQQSQTFILSKSNAANGNRPEQVSCMTFYRASINHVLNISLVLTSTITSGGIIPDIYFYADDLVPAESFIEDLGIDPGT